ncbi:MAG: right-handed parallel beta-helix repeat-containing protein, partial [Candidatus Eisenbacteria sp.]|nr:right-handed parallel beta-helix repeat-containing protein [Candidatus Eisenbacteria bacterium]
MKTTANVLASIVALALLALPVQATTIHAPGDQPTIQAGIDAASAGDTVLVACGTYYEHDITMKSGVCLTSETGSADCVEINAQSLGRVFYCADVNSLASFVGLTLRDGATDFYENGGGMYCTSSSPTLTNCTFLSNIGYSSSGGGLVCSGGSSPTVTSCEFTGNTAFAGGAAAVYSSSPTFTDCVFAGNSAMWGGAMDCGGSSSPTLTRCTFLGNYAGDGGAVECSGTASPAFICCTFLGNDASDGGSAVCAEYYGSPTLTGCVIAFSTSGPAVSCADGSTVALSCCDVYGNVDGDWVGCIADQYGVDGNFSADPLFCGDLNPDEPYTLHTDSPCAPDNNPE